MDNQLFCGAAREKITPPENLLKDLRGLMDSKFGGIVDDLYVRAIALKSGGRRMLLLSFDLDKVPDPKENLEFLEKHTQVEQDYILLTSIHTHSAPVTGDRPYEGPNYIARKPAVVQEATKKYEQLIRKKMLAAAKKALEGLVPAVCGYGYGKSFVNVNRIGLYEVAEPSGEVQIQIGTGTNFEREADRTLFVMKFETLEGKPLAYFMNYPVHNTVMILNGCGKEGKVGITSDLGGNVSKYMEKAYEGCVAMWTSGAAGDLNPVMSNQVYREDFAGGVPVEYYEKEGSVALSMLKTLTAHHFADIRRTARKIQNTRQDIELSAGMKWTVTPGKEKDGNPVPYKVRVHKLRIGTVVLMGFSGELYSGLGKELKQRSGEQNLILVNHDASLLYNTGYIYGDEIFALKEQYVGEIVGMNHTWLQPGYIADSLAECIDELLEAQPEKGPE